MRAFAGKRILLLQGPFGPFFRRLARDLRGAGAQVFKINFNAGDVLFYPLESVSFRSPLELWPTYLEQFIISRGIDVLILFGDCRQIHRDAIDVARLRSVRTFVFEEGYVRPNHVTFEMNGVNGNSSLPKDPEYYRQFPDTEIESGMPVGNWIWLAVIWGFFYYLVACGGRFLFPEYRHHRRLSLLEAPFWWLSFARKYWYAWSERGKLEELTRAAAPPFYLVPLQVRGDYQLHVHSSEGSIENFIAKVARSFHAHAPANARLVFKHHPMDRGYVSYSRFIAQLRARLGLGERVVYLHDQHLPTLLRHAAGMVTINSTVGMSAMVHEVPVLTLGRANYDIRGLTYQGTLDAFWSEAPNLTIDMGLFRSFRNAIIHTTQLNGNFYKPTPGSPNVSGLNWPLSHPSDATDNVIQFPPSVKPGLSRIR